MEGLQGVGGLHAAGWDGLQSEWSYMLHGGRD